MDAPDINAAVNVLRIGQSGIGFSKSGVDGPYYSAWTIDGRFNADFIQAGSIKSNDEKSVVIDLDKGTASLNGSVTTESEKAKSVLSAGRLSMYYDNGLRGFLSSTSWNGAPGTAIYNTNQSKIFSFYGQTNPDDPYYLLYALNLGADPEGYTDKHIFWGAARFIGGVSVAGSAQFNNGVTVKGTTQLDGSVKLNHATTLDNGVGLWALDADGVGRYVVGIDANNNLLFGNNTSPVFLLGDDVTIYGNKSVSIQNLKTPTGNKDATTKEYVDQEAEKAKSQANQNLQDHTGNKNNPHGVTAAQVGARPDTWTPSASDVGAMAARPVQVEFAGASGHGGYIDFHYGKSTADYTSRIIEASSGTLDVNGVSMSGGDIGAKNINLRGVDAPTINFASSAATISVAGTSNQLHFKSKGNMLFYPASANGTYFALLGKSMYHSTDNAVSCGASTKRWSTVYAGTGTINTSDRNEKENIQDIDEKYIRLFEKLRPVTYEFIGDNHDRIHIGYISQEVKEAMDEVGLTDLEFAGYCRDKKTEDVLDENGVLVGQKDVLDENGEQAYLYALRYAEFVALNTKMIQLQQKKIEAMERELRELKEKQK
jgi:hypothetical protein